MEYIYIRSDLFQIPDLSDLWDRSVLVKAETKLGGPWSKKPESSIGTADTQVAGTQVSRPPSQSFELGPDVSSPGHQLATHEAAHAYARHHYAYHMLNNEPEKAQKMLDLYNKHGAKIDSYKEKGVVATPQHHQDLADHYDANSDLYSGSKISARSRKIFHLQHVPGGVHSVSKESTKPKTSTEKPIVEKPTKEFTTVSKPSFGQDTTVVSKVSPFPSTAVSKPSFGQATKVGRAPAEGTSQEVSASAGWSKPTGGSESGTKVAKFRKSLIDWDLDLSKSGPAILESTSKDPYEIAHKRIAEVIHYGGDHVKASHERLKSLTNPHKIAGLYHAAKDYKMNDVVRAAHDKLKKDHGITIRSFPVPERRIKPYIPKKERKPPTTKTLMPKRGEGHKEFTTRAFHHYRMMGRPHNQAWAIAFRTAEKTGLKKSIFDDLYALSKAKRLGKHITLSKDDLHRRLNSGHFSLVSAGRNSEDPNEKDLPEDHPMFRERHEKLRHDLVQNGFDHTEVEGHWGGKEKTFLVHHIHRPEFSEPKPVFTKTSFMVHHTNPAEHSTIRDLGKKYNQQSVIHSRGGIHECHYVTGEHKDTHNKGKGFELKPEAEDLFTKVQHPKDPPTKFELKFDWDKKHPMKDAVLKSRNIFDDLFYKAMINIDKYKYKGPNQNWVHMVHRDNESEEFEGSPTDRPLTPHVKGQVSVTSFNPKKRFPVRHAGRKGYVFSGKPTHYFPFDAHSTRDPSGMRVSHRDENDVPEKPESWDEGWLHPSKSKLVGHIFHTKERSLEGFKNDKEGLSFLHQRPNHKAFVRLAHGPIHEVSHEWIGHHLGVGTKSEPTNKALFIYL